MTFLTPGSARHQRVAVFSLGGTIAMTNDGSGGVAPALSGARLLEVVPGLLRPASKSRSATITLAFQRAGATPGAAEQAAKTLLR